MRSLFFLALLLSAATPQAQVNSTTIHLAPPNNHGQPDEEIANRFDPAWDKCSEVVIAHITTMESAEVCKRASDIANEFPPDRRYTERRYVYVYTATAFANAHDLKTALLYAEKAVAVVKLGHDDNPGSGSAYSIRGKLRAFSGDMKGGDEDLLTAEGFDRKADNSALLKKDLQFHADLLKRMNRPQDAQVKLDEASKL
jgi:hypothetical protein